MGNDLPTNARGPTPLRLVLHETGGTVSLRRGGLIFGRHSRADVRLPHPDVSRLHCRFDWEAGQWEVVDLESLNGLYVNGVRVRQRDLRHRDCVRIGGLVFEVDLAQDNSFMPLAEESEAVLRSIVDVLEAPAAASPLRHAS